MGFVRRRGKTGERDAVDVNGLVVHAPAPPVGGPHIGPGSHAELRIWCDWGAGGRMLAGRMRLTEAHWLVPGMEVPVLLDPDKPERFEVQWDRVPSMEARAAANDPALADPIAARRRVASVLGLARSETGSSRTEAVERALADAARRSAPPGWQCAVVIIATIRGRRVITGDADNASSHDMITYTKGSDAVLSVNVAGRRPYALFVHHFKCEVDLLETEWQPLPALVSADSPSEFEILWDEVPSHDRQLQDRIAGSIAAQQERSAMVADFSQAQMAALNQLPHVAHEPGASSAAADLGALRSDLVSMAAENARRTLQFVQDPEMRKMLIEQYRAAGIDVGVDS